MRWRPSAWWKKAWPPRAIGLHFFNPVPASKLVEVVIADSTPEQLVEDAKGW
ncbi:hypothetical protein HT105_23325, partial [Bacteroides fragilis]|nr:hypothetical protein [Bacteroides fragilis]